MCLSIAIIPILQWRRVDGAVPVFYKNKIKKIKGITFWNQIKGPTLDPRGHTLLLLTVVLLRVLWFLPTIPPLGGSMPPMIWQS